MLVPEFKPADPTANLEQRIMAMEDSLTLPGNSGHPVATLSDRVDQIESTIAALPARVVSYNSIGRFVVLAYPPSRMPKLNQAAYGKIFAGQRRGNKCQGK